MRKINRLLASLGSAVLLAGCTNALYFYETDKVSLTVEARPDPSQPAQGSLGVKERVALVVPKTERTKGDALSAISSFSFKITPKPFPEFNPVLIQTVFITGDAAAGSGDSNKVARAILPPSSTTISAKNIVDSLDEADRNELKQLTARDYDTLTNVDRNKILSVIGIADMQEKDYTRDLHEELQSLLNP